MVSGSVVSPHGAAPGHIDVSMVSPNSENLVSTVVPVYSGTCTHPAGHPPVGRNTAVVGHSGVANCLVEVLTILSRCGTAVTAARLSASSVSPGTNGARVVPLALEVTISVSIAPSSKWKVGRVQKSGVE